MPIKRHGRAVLVLLSLLIGLDLCIGKTLALPTSARAEAAIKRHTPHLSAALAEKGLRLGSPLYIAIFKEERALEVHLEGPDGRYRHFKTYPICRHSGGLGPKERRGDGQAPEGFYWVGPSQLNPSSRFHLSFNLGYPNAHDRARGWTGSALMVHGACVSIGCYAMTDPVIEEIYTLMAAAFEGGAGAIPVHAFPFRLTDANLARHAGSAWTAFWSTLKEGYDAFTETGRPPAVTVEGGRYRVQRAPS